jgi:hypothetical protein
MTHEDNVWSKIVFLKVSLFAWGLLYNRLPNYLYNKLSTIKITWCIVECFIWVHYCMLMFVKFHKSPITCFLVVIILACFGVKFILVKYLLSFTDCNV